MIEPSTKGKSYHSIDRTTDVDYATMLAQDPQEKDDDEVFYPDEVEDNMLDEDEATEVLLAIASGGEVPRRPRARKKAPKVNALRKTDRGFRDRNKMPPGRAQFFTDRTAEEESQVRNLQGGGPLETRVPQGGDVE